MGECSLEVDRRTYINGPGPLEVSGSFINQLSAEIGCHVVGLSEATPTTLVTKLRCIGGDDFDTVAVLALHQKKLILVSDGLDSLQREVLQRCGK